MPTSFPSQLRRRGYTALLALAAAALSGCGSSGPPERGLLIAGPGVRATSPPWTPQYRDLARRIAQLRLPVGGNEKFHIHALLSIYNQGLYVTVPANVGLDERHHVESSLHTHDATGIVHMEAAAPFRYTLGDFFAVWGVRFGAGTLGALQDGGQNRVWVYVDRKLIKDPARHVLVNNDDISIGYGPKDSFPHRPGTSLLKQVESGGSALSCSASTAKKKKTPCLAPKPTRKVK
jgi:Prokaryotic lipoprotein-attachment site